MAKEENKETAIHRYKQITATFASSLLSVGAGLTLGFTAGLLPQLRHDEGFPYDPDYDSWIASVTPLAMVIGCLCAGFFIDGLGRKTGHVLLTVPFSVGWLILAFATNTPLMILGRFITGFCTGATRTTSIVYLGEVSDPKFRSTSLFSLSLSAHTGRLISHIISSYLYWRVASCICVVPNIISLLLFFYLRESPLWLIAKGKTENGIKTYAWFRGNGEVAEKELNQILERQKEKTGSNTKEILNTVFSKQFVLPFLTTLTLSLNVQFCGVNILTFYAPEIFRNTFKGDVDPFMLMIVSDCIRILASIVICSLAKYLPRKLSFLTCSFGAATFLIFIVIILKLNLAMVWLLVTCLIIYVTFATTLVSFALAFVAELFPSNIRGFGSGLSSAISFGLLFVSVNITPKVMASYGEVVLYSIFAIVTLICAVILAFLLPETNGKSLQDIEDAYNDKETKVT